MKYEHGLVCFKSFECKLDCMDMNMYYGSFILELGVCFDEMNVMYVN